MSNRAIIVVDIQNEYFPGGKLQLEGIEKAAANAARVIEHARSAKDLVIYVQHESADPAIPFFTPRYTRGRHPLHGCTVGAGDSTSEAFP
ncbi:hypothetical protein HSBAA_21530 [Vreelandella sulfidaeris]|uniref:Isochorismatase-like domain-containing protein n=1 Tax=Vreelandella sulfidaeris TaxID=115553 RepID=A0A455U5P2_9GAMM|nr:hypothetical protein HSBAA_21530 [Halomonas sulfidaeris]